MATATVMAPGVEAPADGDGPEAGSDHGGQCLESDHGEATTGPTSTPPPDERPVLADGSTEASPSEPPEEATLQTDGSYLTELPDRPTEPNREDFDGEVEGEHYAPPPSQEENNAVDDEDPKVNDEGDASKHPLESRWCFWVNRRAKLQANLSWSERGNLAYEFETAEDFWCMHHHSFPPSQLENIDCSLFKKGFTPTWEDPLFGCGGRWVVRLEKVSAQLLDSLWLSLSMALVGEGFAEHGGDVVAGAIVSVRNRTTRLALWLTKATDEKKVMGTGYGFRSVLVDTEGAVDIESKEFVFEDFRTQAINLQLPRPGVTGLTEGIFQ